MGKIIVQKYEQNVTNRQATTTPTRQHETHNNDDLIEEVEIEEVTIEDVDDADGAQYSEQLITNRLRGFRRTTPSTEAEKQKGDRNRSVSFASIVNDGRANSAPSSEPQSSQPLRGKLFCHFFNNSRNCPHGNGCKFLHDKAPICRFDLHCSKQRCMFQHPQEKAFLERNPTSMFPPSPPPPMFQMPWMFPQMDPRMFPAQWNNSQRGWENANRN